MSLGTMWSTLGFVVQFIVPIWGWFLFLLLYMGYFCILFVSHIIQMLFPLQLSYIHQSDSVHQVYLLTSLLPYTFLRNHQFD